MILFYSIMISNKNHNSVTTGSMKSLANNIGNIWSPSQKVPNIEPMSNFNFIISFLVTIFVLIAFFLICTYFETKIKMYTIDETYNIQKKEKKNRKNKISTENRSEVKNSVPKVEEEVFVCKLCGYFGF